VTEFSKGVDYTKVSNSVKTERNRLVSWESPVQELTKPAVVIPSPRNAITLKPLEFVSKVTKLMRATLLQLPYTLVNVLSPIRILRTINQSFFPIEINVLNVVFKFGSEI
jgi:hypothetical protein